MRKEYAFGVDLGGTTVKIGFFTADGNLIDMWEIKTRKEENGKFILPDIAKAVEDKIKEKNISKDDVKGIGLGVPGPVTEDGTVNKCINLGWGVFNVEKTLSELTGLKVKAGNDANVAAFGEMWQGGGKGYKNIVMVTLGTGVGGGVILNGNILYGSDGAAGEIGHICVNDDDDFVCGCGNTGCLETYSSASGVVRMTKKYLEQNPNEETVLRNIEDLQAKDIFDAAKQGDKIAAEQCEQAGRYLGKALAAVSAAVNPEAFVIGGGMARAGEILMESIERNYKKYAFHACRNAKFNQASLGNNAGIYGGVYMLLN